MRPRRQEEYMGLIEWSKEYSVGIAKIDNQHKRIVKILNRLMKHQFDTRDEKVTEEILDDLQAYMKEHFRAEEEYILEHHLSGYEEQRREHNQFIDRLFDAQKEYTKDGRLTSLNLFNFVWDWFSHHVLKVDKTMISIG
jgi:hemerythrin-like metal-binding protein